jgi:hypothetical protein
MERKKFNAEKKKMEAFKRKTREEKSNQNHSFNLGAGVLTFL